MRQKTKKFLTNKRLPLFIKIGDIEIELRLLNQHNQLEMCFYVPFDKEIELFKLKKDLGSNETKSN